MQNLLDAQYLCFSQLCTGYVVIEIEMSQLVSVAEISVKTTIEIKSKQMIAFAKNNQYLTFSLCN